MSLIDFLRARLASTWRLTHLFPICVQVKDPTVQQSRACAALKADRRWCCSGTPINTSISDLYGQFVFLGLDPLDDRQTFLDEISRPFERSLLTGSNVFDKSKSALVFLLRNVSSEHTDFVAGKDFLQSLGADL